MFDVVLMLVGLILVAYGMFTVWSAGTSPYSSSPLLISPSVLGRSTRFFVGAGVLVAVACLIIIGGVVSNIAMILIGLALVIYGVRALLDVAPRPIRPVHAGTVAPRPVLPVRADAVVLTRASYLAAAAIGAPVLAVAGILLMLRAGVVFPSLSLGIMSDTFPNPQWVVLGTLCGLIGAAVAYVGLPSYVDLARGFTREGEGRLALPRGSARTSFIVSSLVAVGLYLYVLTQALARQPSSPGPLILLCLVGATALVARATAELTPRRGGRTERGRFAGLTVVDWAIVVATVLAFVLLNLHDLRSWFYAWIGDEWPFYTAAVGIVHGTPVDVLNQAGVYGIFPQVDSAYQALVMRIFGTDVVGWRMSSTLSAALPILPLYWLGKEMGGTAFAVVAAVLYASCDLLWAFAHIGYNNNESILPMVLAGAFFYAGLRDKRLALLFVAGAVAGAGWYTIYMSRLMIGIMGLVLLTDWRDGLLPMLRRQVAMVAGFLLVVAPLVIDSGTDALRNMNHNLPYDGAYPGNVPYLIAMNVVRALYEFFYDVNSDHYLIAAIFTPVAAAALLLGIVLALRQITTLTARLLLVWLIVTLLLSTPLNDRPGVSFTRGMIAIPPAALLAALGLCSVARGLQTRFGRRERTREGPLFTLGLAAALMATVFLSGYRFFVAMPQVYGTNERSMTIGVLSAHRHDTTVLAGDLSTGIFCDDRAQLFDAYGIDPTTVLRFQGQELAPQCPGPSPAPTTAAPSSTAVVLVSDAQLPSVGPCAPRLSRLLLAPNGTQAIWGFVLSVQPAPAATYMARVTQQALRICPSLSALPTPS